MRSRRRRDDLTGFLLRLPLTLAAAVAIWFAAKGAYNEAIGWTAQGLSRLFEYPPAASVVVRDDHAILGRTDLRADSGRLQISLTQIEFNMVPFLALAFAVPRPFSRGRWKRLLAAVGILATAHVLAIILKLKEFYAVSLGQWSVVHYSGAARAVIGVLRFFFDIPVAFGLPLLLWVATYPDQVVALMRLPELQRSRSE